MGALGSNVTGRAEYYKENQMLGCRQGIGQASATTIVSPWWDAQRRIVTFEGRTVRENKKAKRGLNQGWVAVL